MRLTTILNPEGRDLLTLSCLGVGQNRPPLRGAYDILSAATRLETFHTLPSTTSHDRRGVN